jgi:hypothetical protein
MLLRALLEQPLSAMLLRALLEQPLSAMLLRALPQQPLSAMLLVHHLVLVTTQLELRSQLQKAYKFHHPQLISLALSMVLTLSRLEPLSQP